VVDGLFTESGYFYVMPRVDLKPLAVMAVIKTNFQFFNVLDFIAAITRHIPDRMAQMVRY